MHAAADTRRPSNWTVNNFDLIRLLAAVQVLWYHGTVFLGPPPPWTHAISRVLTVLPGVPIFFIISGFLVSASYERSRSVLDYGVKRVLRIYPGLWLCFVFTVVVLVVYGFLKPSLVHSPRILAWVAGQLSIAKGTPSEIRHYMNGAPNGSLWSISVELGFYVLLPLLYVGRIRQAIESRGNRMLLLLILPSLILWLWVRHTAGAGASNEGRVLVDATPLPWLWLFMLGVALSRNLGSLLQWVRGRGHLLAAGYLILALTVLHRGFTGAGYAAELMQAAALLILGVAIVSAAYTRPNLAERLLRRNDLSYGIYLYHYVIIGAVLRSVSGGWSERFAVVAGSTVACAAVSWFAVERPVKTRGRVLAHALGQRLPRFGVATG